MPARAESRLKALAALVLRHVPGRRAEWGTMRRSRPFSTCYGWDRGTPVDRFYIERFLDRHAGDIRGEVLEVRDARYTNRYGTAVVRSHVVDLDADNAATTLVADLCEPRSLPAETYDCVVLTQTLQFLPDSCEALRNLWHALRPGGTILITAPCLSRRDNESPDGDYWRWTPAGLRLDVARCCPGAEAQVEGPGNVLAGVAFLYGLAREELSSAELDAQDDRFPLLATARVRKPPAGAVASRGRDAA